MKIKSILLITFDTGETAAIPVVAQEPDRTWINISDSEAFISDFEHIRMEVSKEDGGKLTMNEISCASGALGYALSVLRGETLSDPEIIINGQAGATLDFFWDSTKSQRDDPDFDDAFGNAKIYAANGSPVRSTNRAGAGTKGTALVNGIGPCTVRFWVA